MHIYHINHIFSVNSEPVLIILHKNELVHIGILQFPLRFSISVFVSYIICKRGYDSRKECTDKVDNVVGYESLSAVLRSRLAAMLLALYD